MTRDLFVPQKKTSSVGIFVACSILSVFTLKKDALDQSNLGGGFKKNIVIPKIWEDERILTSIFFKGVETTC